MAQVYRPTYSKLDTTTGKRVKRKAKKWYVRYYLPDGTRKVVPGFADRRATERLALELETKAERLAAGLANPSDDAALRPLADHAAEFRAYLEAKGNSTVHVDNTCARLSSTLDGCHFQKIADVKPSSVLTFLASLRKRGRSIATANYYLVALKSFTRWLWRDGRASDDPLAGMARLANAGTEVRHARRDFSDEELARLLRAAKASKRTFRGLTGEDRYAVYATAAGTGFRVSELATLTPASFDLDASPPTATVLAAYAKNRKLACQPISSDLATVLAAYLVGRDRDEAIWSGNWSRQQSAEMIRGDLDEARRRWFGEATGDEERRERERSDFLVYKDRDGRFADFHALRHTFISRIVASGASPKVAQTLARHSTITLTLGRYAHAGLYDLTAAVESLPPVKASDLKVSDGRAAS